VIRLERRFHDQIVHQAQEEFPNEACGLIAGKDGVPARLYRMRNEDDSPKTYRFESKEQNRVMNEIDGQGLDLWAIYHSHPATEAYPSKTDRERAHTEWVDPETGEHLPWFPGTYYLIVSLRDDKPVLRAFRFEQGVPVEEEVRIE